MILHDILLVLLLYVLYKRAHSKDIAKQSISEDQSAEEAGKIGTTVQCIHLYHCFYTEANSNKYIIIISNLIFQLIIVYLGM